MAIKPRAEFEPPTTALPTESLF